MRTNKIRRVRLLVFFVARNRPTVRAALTNRSRRDARETWQVAAYVRSLGKLPHKSVSGDGGCIACAALNGINAI